LRENFNRRAFESSRASSINWDIGIVSIDDVRDLPIINSLLVIIEIACTTIIFMPVYIS
jgi:hypothetical protein